MLSIYINSLYLFILITVISLILDRIVEELHTSNIQIPSSRYIYTFTTFYF